MDKTGRAVYCLPVLAGRPGDLSEIPKSDET